jgi:hypothetical protein
MATFRPPKLPAIPLPDETQEGMLASINALKSSVEWLLGTRGSKPATRVFVQSQPPVAQTMGDLWFTELPNLTMSYWDGTAWLPVLVAHDDGTLHTT